MEQVPATPESTAAFSTLAVVAPLDVTVGNADHYAVVVAGDDEDADLVRMSLEDETLSLHLDGDLSSRPTVAVSAPAGALRDLEISEAATVSTLDALTGSQLEVIVRGASSAQLATEDLRQLSVTALGGSTATVTGTRQAESLDAEAAGASTLHLFDLTAADVTARASDGSTVEVTATRSLRATASEVSTLTYRGAPADITEEATEISTITSD